jgi:hypothetical protein
VQVTILRCDGCGAAMTYDATVQAPRCGFCGSVTHLETLDDPMEQTRRYLPFSVGGDEARRALRTWLGSLGFFRPGDLMTASRIEELRPVWWTCWVFDAEAIVSWTADSEVGSGRAAWAPHSGQTQLVFDDIHASASRGLTQVETDFLGPSYDFDSGLPEPAGLGDEQPLIEQFDVQRSAARRIVLNEIQAVASGTIEARHVPGERCRKLHVEVLLRGLETRRLAAPAWVLAYRYDGKLHRVVISGQDASRLKGSAPYSVGRIMAVVAASLLAFVLIVVMLAVLGS